MPPFKISSSRVTRVLVTQLGDTHKLRAPGTAECWQPLAWEGLPWWPRWQRVCLQRGRPGFDPWVGKIPQRREWLPAPVFLPGKLHGQRGLAGCTPCGPQRVGHDWATNTSLWLETPSGSQLSYSTTSGRATFPIPLSSVQCPRESLVNPFPLPFPDPTLGAGGLWDASAIPVPRSRDWSHVKAPEQTSWLAALQVSAEKQQVKCACFSSGTTAGQTPRVSFIIAYNQQVGSAQRGFACYLLGS